MSLTAQKLDSVGERTRFWRRRRRLSQLELALEAELSTKRLCFVETGRSQPSRQLLVHLAERLQIPLRDRSRLMIVTGFAPIYPELAYHGIEMDALRGAFADLLAAHTPNPALPSPVELRAQLGGLVSSGPSLPR